FPCPHSHFAASTAAFPCFRRHTLGFAWCRSGIDRSIGNGTPDPSASGIRSDLHWSRRHASPLASSEFENTWRKGSSLFGFRQLVFTEGLGSGLTYCSAYICGTQSTSIRSQTCQLFHKPFSCELSL
ncbi:unnamed protein product, partial [Musa banksii]